MKTRAKPRTLALLALTACTATAPTEATAPKPFAHTISGTAIAIDLVPIPAGSIEVEDANGAQRKVDVGAFYMSRTEIPWEAYDAFVFGLDEPAPGAAGVDAITRPSHPYITMDRGYGHGGYPVISVSYHGAQEFCRWLSAKSDRVFRLPTEIEWEYACRAEAAGGDARDLDQRAWHRGNSESKTHPCGEKHPNGFGLCDMLGNAAEWCASADERGVLRGGSFRDEAQDVSCAWRKPYDPAWNRSDPQLPRGIWWLADGSFAGFRVVCEARGVASK
jgi:formylglycine-generating enzyme required for sulfatase activity